MPGRGITSELVLACGQPSVAEVKKVGTKVGDEIVKTG